LQGIYSLKDVESRDTFQDFEQTLLLNMWRLIYTETKNYLFPCRS